MAEARKYLDDEMTDQARRRWGREQQATVLGDMSVVPAAIDPRHEPPKPPVPSVPPRPAFEVFDMEFTMWVRPGGALNLHPDPATGKTYRLLSK